MNACLLAPATAKVQATGKVDIVATAGVQRERADFCGTRGTGFGEVNPAVFAQLFAFPEIQTHVFIL